VFKTGNDTGLALESFGKGYISAKISRQPF